MKQRSRYLLSLYATLLLLFVAGKWVFLWTDAPQEARYGVGDALQTAWHGLLLDIPTTGYLVALPLLSVLFTAWMRKPLALRRWATPYYILIAIMMVLAFVADMSLYPFWRFKLDATIFYYIDSPRDAFASVSAGYIAVRTVAVAALTTAVVWLLRKLTPAQLSPLRKPWMALWLVVTIPPLAVSIRGGLGESTANIGKVYFSTDEYLNHSAVNPLFSMLYSLDKAENYADEFNFFGEQQRAETVKILMPDSDDNLTDTLLNTQRPNILIILMESFGGQFIEAISHRTDITPHFNRLAREGILFTHCYSNSFRTDRGTVSTLSGWPAFPTLSVMKLPIKSRTLPCIARSLNSAGYASSFLYGGDINFTNMQSYLRTGGYAHITSDTDFPASARKDNPWGVHDGITFDTLYQQVVRLSKKYPNTSSTPSHSSKPRNWHLCFLTLSSHEPFEVPYQRLPEQIPNAFAYTDECLGRFVERIRQTPAWDNLLIICIPDHGFQYPDNITAEQHHHNMMLWTGGAVKKRGFIDILMTQSDMAATLLAQLSISHSEYTFSHNVLSRGYRYPFAFFTNKENFGFVDSTGYTIYNTISNRIADNQPANTLMQNQPTLQSTPSTLHQKQAARQREQRGKALLQTIYDDLGSR